MGLVTAGLMNKQVAGEIGVSEITAKVHRGSIMRKMGAKSLAELVRMADALGVRRAKLLTPIHWYSFLRVDIRLKYVTIFFAFLCDVYVPLYVPCPFEIS